MAERKLTIGILGCSSIAERQVIPAIIQNKNFHLKLVASRNLAKAKHFSQKFNCGYCGYEELISNDQLDAVYVSLPVALHYEWGKKALLSGKHILMEKTFTHSLNKAEDLVHTAAQKKLIAMEALVYIYHPLYSTVYNLINSGEIGLVKHIDAHFGFPLIGGDNIRSKPELGGGAILDNLIYPLSFSLNIYKKKPDKVHSFITYNNEYKIDERGSLLLDFGKSSANINFGFGLMYRNQYCIWGETGYIFADRVFSRPADFSNEITIARQNENQNIFIGPANQFVNMLTAFADKIIAGSADKRNESDDILARMKIISELYELQKKK